MSTVGLQSCGVIMDRRSFLGGILAAAVAPAIVRAESIMRVRPIVLRDELGHWVDALSVGQDEIGRVHGDRLQIFTGEIGRYESVIFHGPEMRDWGAIAVMSIETADGRRYGVTAPNKMFGHSLQYPELEQLMRENLLEQVLRG